MDAAYRRTPESAIHPTPFSACSFVWDANHAAFSAVGPRFSVSFGPTFSSSFPHLPRGCFTGIYLCLYVCATFMLLTILGRLCRSRGGSLSFVLLSLSFCAPRPPPVGTHDPRVCTIRESPRLLCGPRTHRKDKGKKGIFLMIL